MSLIPPKFGDLSKKAKDLLEKNYNYGFYKFETTFKSETGVESLVKGSSNHDTGATDGSLEMKTKFSKYGIDLKEVWNCADNSVKGELSVADKLIKGGKLTFLTTFFPSTGSVNCEGTFCMTDKLIKGTKLTFNSSFRSRSWKKDGSIKTEYKRDHVFHNMDFDLDITGVKMTTATVLGYSDFLLGCKLVLDAAKSQLTKHELVFAYNQKDVAFSAAVKDGKEFTGMAHFDVSKNWETAVEVNYKQTDATTSKFTMGANYKDGPTTFRGKIDTNRNLGLGLTHLLRPGFSLHMSTLVDTKQFSTGGQHKFGLGIEYKPE